MNYLKLPDKDKLRIIERKVYETHNIYAFQSCDTADRSKISRCITCA